MHAKLKKLEKMNLCYKMRTTDTLIFLMACISVELVGCIMRCLSKTEHVA